MSLINGLLALLGEIESDAIAVHEERCISVRNRNADCLRCVEACTSGALAYRAGELLVEPERCIGCGTCATACPTCAIELRNPTDAELTAQLKHSIVATKGHPVIVCEQALEALRRIRDMELASRPQMDYARNMFLLSFYLRGMSFVDMAYLKREDLQNGMLTYCRKKTGQRLSIRWEPCMQQIVERYPNGNPAYLLPILVRSDSDERRQYKNVGHLINRNLRKLGRELGLAVPLTMYVARHTWASVARSRNIPLSVISESMGHDSEATTRIYLASLDTAVVDQANRLVINSLSEEDLG